MKKLLVILLAIALIATMAVGCTSDNTTDENNEGTDVVTTASLVNEADALATAMSADGTWIIAILNDVETDQDLVLEGEFYNKDDSSKDLYRKLALYAQDENHKVTAGYTLTAPKLTVKSPNGKIQNGTFVGDLYVEANGFTLTGTKIDGNVFFATQEAKDTFTMESGATITGTTQIDGADVVTSASLVQEDTAFINAISADGTWIIAPLNSISTKEEIVLEGDFHNKNDAAQDLYRKIAPYTQDADHNVLSQFTISAPLLTIKSPNAKIQNGTFEGDIVVEAEGFNLQGSTVEGSIYFASEDLKTAFETNSADYNVTGEVVVGERPIEEAAE